MRAGTVSNDFAGILKSVTLNKENSFRIGEVLKGRVMGFSDGKPILSLKGEIFSATSKVPLRLNQDINVYVQKKEGNTTFLKIIDPEGNDTESRNINSLLRNNIDISKLSILEKLLENNIENDNAMLFLKKGFRLSPSFIDLFRTLGQLKDIRNISDFYTKILDILPENRKNEFLKNFLPDIKDSENIRDFLKNSLLSTESKMIFDNGQNFPDLKRFLSENVGKESSEIQKFLDINNVLSSDDRKTVFIQIPWQFNSNEKNFRYSELSFKSENITKKDEVVNIFFILDMSNTDLLKISSKYYIKGKNLEITFFSDNSDLRDMIGEMKDELIRKIENMGLNVWIRTSDIEKKQSGTDKSQYINSGGIDIKA